MNLKVTKLRLMIFLFPVLSFSQADTLQQQFKSREQTRETVDWIHKELIKIQSKAPQDAEILSRLSLDLAEKLNYREGIAQAYFNLGLSYWYRDLHDMAMENYLEALKRFEALEMKSEAARTRMNIGNTYDELGQTNKAKTFIKQSLKSFEELGDSSRVLSGYLNLGVIFFYESNYDSALENFEIVLAHHVARKDTAKMALLHLNIANVYEYMENLPKAIEHYQYARSYVDPTILLAINVDMGLGNALLLNKNPDGIDLIQEGLQKAIQLEQQKMEQFAYESLKEYYVQLSDYQKAYEYLTKEIEIEREWRGKDVQEQIEVLQLKYEDEKKARQLSLLEAEQAEDKFRLAIALSIGSIVLVGAILLFVILKLRIKNARLREIELKQKVEHKSKEVTSYALNFIQKNELLNELAEKVKQIKQNASEKTSKELNQLNNVIRSNMKIDQDWENFKVMFEEVHEGFFMRLKDQFPDLGNSELKLCALLKLNMNLKESSQILGISSDSVKTARSRLRKKLGLKSDENLVDFMIMFDSPSN
ncbi:tetratricopeptide repeat protein [Ekhidna sp.]|uniref:tetratricopeptide repeat protein n=1 Tax=Ekhidna sp. TaxID=2608089 RepID=UPI003B504798